MSEKNRITDPTKVPVQLNIEVPWAFREHLITISKLRGQSLTRTVADALNSAYPSEMATQLAAEQEADQAAIRAASQAKKAAAKNELANLLAQAAEE